MSCRSMVQMKAQPLWKSGLWLFPAVDCYSAVFLVVFLHADGPRMPHPAVAALKGD